MEELINKLVIVELGTYSYSESIKGTVIAVMDDWLKLETKSTFELINLREVKRIIEKKA